MSLKQQQQAEAAEEEAILLAPLAAADVPGGKRKRSALAAAVLNEDIGEADGAHQSSARAKRSWDVGAHGVIPLTNLRDSQYVGPVGVGTDRAGSPQSIISVVFDTGSTNLWISSTLCQSDLCTSREQYNPTESTSYADHVPKAQS